MLSQTLTAGRVRSRRRPQVHRGQVRARDLQGMLVSPDEAARKAAAARQVAAAADRPAEPADRGADQEAAADAFKSVTQGQKNAPRRQDSRSKLPPA
jgi:hypothetical protein